MFPPLELTCGAVQVIFQAVNRPRKRLESSPPWDPPFRDLQKAALFRGETGPLFFW